MTEAEGMEKIRRQLAEYASRPETYVPVDARAFGHLDLAFYDRTQSALQSMGFVLLGDFEIAEVKGRSGDPHCFVRSMAAGDGTMVAAMYHPKPALWLRLLLWLTGKPLGKMIELETEFSDDTFIANCTPPTILLDPPPLLIRQFHPAGIDLEKLVTLHRSHVRSYLAANTGVTIRRVTDTAGMIRMQQRQHAIKGVYREMVGGMTAEEIRRLGGFSKERAAKFKRIMDEGNPSS